MSGSLVHTDTRTSISVPLQCPRRPHHTDGTRARRIYAGAVAPFLFFLPGPGAGPTSSSDPRASPHPQPRAEANPDFLHQPSPSSRLSADCSRCFVGEKTSKLVSVRQRRHAPPRIIQSSAWATGSQILVADRTQLLLGHNRNHPFSYLSFFS
jgi:hypothetical protein